ncbi:MAG TPA: hypothetical protein DCS80_00585 [Betaproteobacteria bacterium]|nr:hypothetical protein [Betaproteobacteria bacterium]
MTESKCARCSTTFPCGMVSDQPCWCSTDFPNILSGNQGDTCLCPHCLTQTITSRLDPSENGF